MKLYKFLVRATSTVYYERELIASDEHEAIEQFTTTLDDNDRTCEENFEVYEITKTAEATEHDYD